jgi:hypothetical protein
VASERGGFGRRCGEPCHFDMFSVQVQVPTSYFLRTVPAPIQNPVPYVGNFTKILNLDKISFTQIFIETG